MDWRGIGSVRLANGKVSPLHLLRGLLASKPFDKLRHIRGVFLVSPMTTAAEGAIPVDEGEQRTAERLNNLLQLVAVLLVVTFFMALKSCVLSSPPFNP
jgi:hypothetical protein